jgi:hypothetical protein
MALSLRVVNHLQQQEYNAYTDKAGHQKRAVLWKISILQTSKIKGRNEREPLKPLHPKTDRLMVTMRPLVFSFP